MYNPTVILGEDPTLARVQQAQQKPTAAQTAQAEAIEPEQDWGPARPGRHASARILALMLVEPTTILQIGLVG